ncbi:MAG: sigma-70 family RNA polymerase sigma factor [Lachnospiraceae bacterium]|nr:sigma-70 family RNA polymerase sigma factor [Lachnospiraceae bacterium]
MTDREFAESLEAIRARDQSGLIRIYNEYSAYLYQIVFSVVGSKEDAEDITSDLFLKLWETPPAYRPGNGHKGYLATIARNRAIDSLRASQRVIPTDFLEEPQLGAVPSSEEELVNEMAVEQILAKLSPSEREIVSMKHLMGLTFREIAEATGRPQGTVAWVYREALAKIRRCGYDR